MIFYQILPAGLSGAFNLGSFLSTIIWGSIIIFVCTIIIIYVKNKRTYQYYGFVLKKRQNDLITGLPSSSVLHGKAGYTRTRRSGKSVFRIKYGFAPWQYVETSKMPDPAFMIGNMVFYEQVQKDNLVQCKVDLNWEFGKIKIMPVEDDTKFGAALEMNENRNIVNQKALTPIQVGMMIMGMIIVAGIIVFYFLSKANGTG